MTKHQVIAQKLGYANADDAGFRKFIAGDTIVDFHALNKETGENEPVVLRGRVVDFIDTPLYDRFLQEYGEDLSQEKNAKTDAPQND